MYDTAEVDRYSSDNGFRNEDDGVSMFSEVTGTTEFCSNMPFTFQS